MMIRHYRFAGIEITIHMPEDKVYVDEYRLKSFATDTVNNPWVYRYEMVQMLDENFGICIAKCPEYRVYQNDEQRVRYIGSVERTLDGAYIRVANCGQENVVQLLEEKYPIQIGAKTVLNSIGAEHLIVQAGGVILHCSYIARGGKAILFTAPSETGKSTQAELWNKYRGSEIINGDRAAVRIVDGKVLAEGIPFAGSSIYCKNRSLPVEAIVYLGQAPRTTIRRIQGYEAFSKIWEGVSVNLWDREDTELASNTVLELAKRIPVFCLACTPDKSAILALENALKEYEEIGKEENNYDQE